MVPAHAHAARWPIAGRGITHDWDPDDEGPRRVRELARNLVTLSAT